MTSIVIIFDNNDLVHNLMLQNDLYEIGDGIIKVMIKPIDGIIKFQLDLHHL